LNAISSNLANANTISRNEAEVYRSQHPVFETLYSELTGRDGPAAGVRVTEVVESDLPARREYAPHHPMADDNGFIYRPAVNSVEEVANMLEASRSYQSSVEAMNTAKQMILRTLTLGR
jgi:flagellar basal-body rod protein FlgC